MIDFLIGNLGFFGVGLVALGLFLLWLPHFGLVRSFMEIRKLMMEEAETQKDFRTFKQLKRDVHAFDVRRPAYAKVFLLVGVLLILLSLISGRAVIP